MCISALNVKVGGKILIVLKPYLKHWQLGAGLTADPGIASSNLSSANITLVDIDFEIISTVIFYSHFFRSADSNTCYL